MKVLLLEDNMAIADGLAEGLFGRGIRCDHFESGRMGSDALFMTDYDAVILDLGLPDIDGLEILKKWRKSGNETPVLILTARDALPDKLSGLNNGADDYLCKPFALDEVAARLRALARRRFGRADESIVYGSLQLYTDSRTATLNGQVLNLSSREWQLLELLLSNKGRVLSRAKIEDKLYSWDQDVESNAVEVHVHHLRKKIGRRFILTKRGIGYQIGEPPQ